MKVHTIGGERRTAQPTGGERTTPVARPARLGAPR